MTIVRFADQAQGFIGRLMYDAVSGHLHFYLLSDDMTQTRGIRVILPEVGLSGVTDVNGAVDFGPQEAPTCREVQIVLPRAVVMLEPLALAPERSREEHHFALKNLDDGDIEITISREESPARYRLTFRRMDGRPTLRELKVVAITDLRTVESAVERGVAVVQAEAPECLLKIHIY